MATFRAAVAILEAERTTGLKTAKEVVFGMYFKSFFQVLSHYFRL